MILIPDLGSNSAKRGNDLLSHHRRTANYLSLKQIVWELRRTVPLAPFSLRLQSLFVTV